MFQYINSIITGMFLLPIFMVTPSIAKDRHVSKITQEAVETVTLEGTNDLVHTKLDVRFNYKKRYLYGKEWVTLKPHFKSTDKLRLNAKGMDINKVSMVKPGKTINLRFTYQDKLILTVYLDRTYQKNERYTIYINYVAKPEEAPRDPADTLEKGLFFINPDSSFANKPVQIWTHGETQNSSYWFPTIDEPFQKTTQEISLTVPAKYVTLSNGLLIKQYKNGDGTRTDTWKMSLPHSPYLFMLAVGDFKVYHDKWRNIPVDYYLEPKFARYAKDIFGFTPEVINFFSNILGVDYPWAKYAQIVLRDFSSGGMENTTATELFEDVQMSKRELLDAYFDQRRSDIVHELFHQWFGDDVTCRDWANVALNESFARFSETMWAEHKYGADAGDAHINQNRLDYFYTPGASEKELIRKKYLHTREVFDVVSYEKGAAILYMLRDFVGKNTFNKGLNIYLRANAFKSVDAQSLQMAMEKASGLDLQWFFNQWFFGSGHPLLEVNYNWNAVTKTETVFLQQSQPDKVFQLPMYIDIYVDGAQTRHRILINKRSDTLNFKLKTEPQLVNVDGDRSLLMQKKEHKTLANYVFQYFNAPLYLDRKEALDSTSNRQSYSEARRVIIAALNDQYYGLRIRAIQKLDSGNIDINTTALPLLLKLAQNDENTLVRAAALEALGKYKNNNNLPIYMQALTSPSYAVQGAALNGLALIDSSTAFSEAKKLEKDHAGALTTAIIGVYAAHGNDTQWDFVNSNFSGTSVQNKFHSLENYAVFVARVINPKYCIDGIKEMKNLGIQNRFSGVVPPLIVMLTKIRETRIKMNDLQSAELAKQAIEALK